MLLVHAPIISHSVSLQFCSAFVKRYGLLVNNYDTYSNRRLHFATCQMSCP